MWIEKSKDKYRACAYYRDPMTGKRHKAGVTMEKNTPQARNKASAELDALIMDKQSVVPDKMHLADLMRIYETEQGPQLKPSTMLRNMSKFHVFMRIFGNVDINTLNAGYVKRMLLEHDARPGTYNENLLRFKAIMRWAYKNDFISDIRYLDKLEPLKSTERRDKLRSKFLEQSECAALLGAMNMEMWRGLTEFLILSGLRVGEAIALDEADLDFIKREITVSKTYDANNHIVTAPKTYASNRTVYMQDDLYRLSRSLVDSNKVLRRILYIDHTPLFFDLSGDYAHYDAYRKYLRETSLKALGRPITPHVLRHTHASLLAEHGLPYDVISRRLGHEDSRITKEIYIHITEKRKAAENEQLKKVHLL